MLGDFMTATEGDSSVIWLRIPDLSCGLRFLFGVEDGERGRGCK